MRICFFRGGDCPVRNNQKVYAVYFDSSGYKKFKDLGSYDSANLFDMAFEYSKLWKRHEVGDIAALGLQISSPSPDFSYDSLLKSLKSKAHSINESLEHMKSLDADFTEYGLGDDPLLFIREKNRKEVRRLVAHQRVVQDLFDGVYRQAENASKNTIPA